MKYSWGSVSVVIIFSCYDNIRTSCHVLGETCCHLHSCLLVCPRYLPLLACRHFLGCLLGLRLDSRACPLGSRHSHLPQLFLQMHLQPPTEILLPKSSSKREHLEYLLIYQPSTRNLWNWLVCQHLVTLCMFLFQKIVSMNHWPRIVNLEWQVVVCAWCLIIFFWFRIRNFFYILNIESCGNV